MRLDDDHDHYVRCETLEELEEICHWIDFYDAHYRHQDGKEGWEEHYKDILKSIELFGIMNVSLYFDEYQRFGDHLDGLLLGFWINLKEATYNEGSIYFRTAKHINIIDGYLWVDYSSSGD